VWFVETLSHDIKSAWKHWLNRPGLTLVALIVLALGIGANTAIFSVVNGVLLHPLPYHHPDRLFRLFETVQRESMASNRMEVAPANFLDWQVQAASFSGLVAYASSDLPLSSEGDAVVVPSALVSHNFFEVLQVQPLIGRTFGADEDRPANEFVALLSYGLWQTRFGANREVLGKTILLDGSSYTIVGVMPPGFRFPDDAQLWTPLALNERQVAMREAHFLKVVGRLRPGVTLAQAQAEIDGIAARFALTYPETNKNWGVSLVSLLDQEVGKVRPALILLFATVGVVLLIACANIANFQLVKAASRQTEIAVRAALGATRWRLIRQLLTESLMLASIGGAFALLLAWWVLDALVALAPQKLPRSDQIALDPTVLAFTLLLSGITGVSFGLIPAVSATRLDLVTMLKQGSERQGGAASRSRMLGALVIAEVALAMIALLGAGLVINSFIRLQRVETGLDVGRVLTVRLAAPSAYYNDPNRWRENRLAFYNQLMPQLKELPGVEAAAAVDSIPLSGHGRVYRFRKEGDPDSNANPAATYEVATTDYFTTVGMRVLQGRFFSEEDREGTTPVVVVNSTMAHRFWPDEDAVGKRIFIRNQQYPREIVGVVNDVRHFGLDREVTPAMYVPYAQQVIDLMPIVIRTKGDPSQISSLVREQVRLADPRVAVMKIETLSQIESGSLAERRFSLVLLAIFGLLAVLLASIGIYGVVTYSVTQRSREIGIRFALGADRRDIFSLVVGRGMRLAITGVGIGLAASLFLTRMLSGWLSGQLFNVGASDPLTLSSIAALLLVITLVSCWLPARRAGKLDPIVALRHE
jgi:putative ABC transport system permease protein